MIHELRTYQIAVGKMPIYLDVAEKQILPALRQFGIEPLGFWTTEIGPLNQVIHLWQFESLADREAKWAQWYAYPERSQILAALEGVVLEQETKILKPTKLSKL